MKERCADKPWWNRFKLVALILVVVFVPCLRSCGNLSLGFPAVIIGAGNGPVDFKPLNGLLNVVIVVSVFLVLWQLYRRIQNPIRKKHLLAGFHSVLFYQALILFGYAVIYPFYPLVESGSLSDTLCMAYLLLIHPYFGLASWLSGIIPDSLALSFLFGDSLDIPMRLGYLVMCALWFALGVTVSAFREKRRRTKAAVFP